MLSWFGEALYRLQGVVLLAAFIIIVAAAVFGFGVFDSLTKSSVPDPTSESAKANVDALVASTFSTQSTDVVLLLSNSNMKAPDPAFAQAVTRLIDTLKARLEVVSLTSYYATHNPNLLSRMS